MTLSVTDLTFDAEVMKADRPVLVDFAAEWCRPCRDLAPVLATLAEDKKAQLKIVTMDVDASPATPARYRVRGIPTLLLVQNGEVVDMTVGAKTQRQLNDWLGRHGL